MAAVGLIFDIHATVSGRARLFQNLRNASLSRRSVTCAAATKKVFIDGEAGTTGLQVRERLAAREDIEIISLTGDDRKDLEKRAEYLNSADAAILCLPDDAAIEAVSLVTDPDVVIIDASTAHRVADDWTYGFPELDADQAAKVAASKRLIDARNGSTWIPASSFSGPPPAARQRFYTARPAGLRKTTAVAAQARWCLT